MITEKELSQAIRECEKEPITASKVSKLADLYIIQDHLFGYNGGYSYSNAPAKTVENVIEINGDTDFLSVVNGKKSEKVWAVIDEVMEVVKTLHPKMYDRVIEKIEDL